MKKNELVKEHTNPVVLAGPIPLEDKSKGYNKIYWVCGIAGALFGMGGGLPGAIVGCLLFCLFGRVIKNTVMSSPVNALSLTEYQLFSPVSIEDILVKLVANNTNDFKITHLKDKIVISKKFAEYKIVVDNDNLTFRVEVGFTKLGAFTNRRLYAKLYKRAIQDIGPIAYAVQLASK